MTSINEKKKDIFQIIYMLDMCKAEDLSSTHQGGVYAVPKIGCL